jgi:hypothetical protein
MTTTFERVTERSHTYTPLSSESKEWNRFLKRVIRDNEASLDWQCNWDLYASLETDWFLEFRRTIKGQIGDPDKLIVVRSDLQVRIDYCPGMSQSFSDSDPVMLAECKSIHISSYDMIVACTLLQNAGPRVWVTGSAGSTSSSKLGLSFYDVQIGWSALRGRYVNLGHQSVAVNGRSVCSGSVSL